MTPSHLETHAITSHAAPRPRRPKSESRLEAETQRARLLERLEDEDAEDLAGPLRKCGEAITLTCLCCGLPNKFEKRCNRKWCPCCARALAARQSLRYEGLCRDFQWPLFATFTVKNLVDARLDFIRDLRRSFGRLRRLRWFARAVAGGVVGFEVTNTGKGWHPHCHCLLDCRWLAATILPPNRSDSAEKKKARFRAAAREVTEQWTLCCRQKAGVKVKRAYASAYGSNDSIAREIIKYSVKGSDLIESPDPIAAVLRMLDGTRLRTTFGSAYGHLRDFDLPKQPTSCEGCGNTGGWISQGELSGHLKRARR